MKKCILTGYYRSIRIDFDGDKFKVMMKDKTWQSFLKYDLAIKHINSLYKSIKPMDMIGFMADGKITHAKGTVLPDGGLIVRRVINGLTREYSSSLMLWFPDTPKNRKLVVKLNKADKLHEDALRKLRKL